MNGRALVAWNLRKLRVERGLSQEQLAVDANLDRTYVGGLERETENPTVGVLDQLAAALTIHVAELFREPRRGATRPAPLKGGRKPAIR
jgi:transcriptional regulator with XRE-family HTH domain